jgi:glyoxylase-like metal-dependent hydrolase (beta-lactamase superfamily II)
VINEFADTYNESPLIYAKICTEISTIVIIDTGCGGATDDPDIDLKSLRTFIETVAVADNGGRPMNEQGKMGYIVVLSHCHYDHICK